MAIDIIINGVCGRMGREIANVALSDSDIRISGCTEITGHQCIGRKLGEITGNSGCDVVIRDNIMSCTVNDSIVIDFTSPKATVAMLKAIQGESVRLVIGTTGMTADQESFVRDISHTHAVLFSPNMSLGVNILFYLTKIAAKKLGSGFDIEIIEAHHRMKKDAPSGTARRLAEIAAKERGLSYSENTVHGREGIVGQRPDRQIGMHAVRGGDIAGDHTVLFAGNGERVELRHIAHGRETLARGAIAAAKWLSDKPSGLYSIQDMLEL